MTSYSNEKGLANLYLAGGFQHSSGIAHPIFRQVTERNTGTEVATASGATADLPSAIALAVDQDAMPEDLPDYGGEEEEEEEEPKPASGSKPEATGSGVSDKSWGDGRAPTEMNWGLEKLPERVPESALKVLVRKGPRTDPRRQLRIDVSLVKMLGWVLELRRATLQQFNRSPVSGSITLLAPHYKEGMEKMYADIKRVARYVVPDQITAAGIGDQAVADDLNKGVFMCLALPWDEDETVEAAVKGYEAGRLQPCRERVEKMTRGSHYIMYHAWGGGQSSGIAITGFGADVASGFVVVATTSPTPGGFIAITGFGVDIVASGFVVVATASPNPGGFIAITGFGVDVVASRFVVVSGDNITDSGGGLPQLLRGHAQVS